MKVNVQNVSGSRERVIAYLALLTSREVRSDLGERLGHEHLAFELCRLWFDEVYVAGNRYFEGLKGDFSQEDASRFRQAFSNEEIAALERFSRFLELRLQMVPDAILKKKRIPETDAWLSLLKDAAYLLDDLDPDYTLRKPYLKAWTGSRSEMPEDLRRLDDRATGPA